MSRRVYELARECGIPSSRVLSELKAMGEFVRSAASVLPAPVERRVRERLPAPSTLSAPIVQDDVDLTTRGDGPRRPRLQVRTLHLDGDAPVPHWQWYRGGALGSLSQYLLDQYVTHRRTDEDVRRLAPSGKYCTREVTWANELAAHWAWAQMHGWDYGQILRWVPTRLPPDVAVGLEVAGVAPGELDWHWDDKGRGTLCDRLVRGWMSADEVVLEVVARRVRS